jgi:hypothetical protein
MKKIIIATMAIMLMLATSCASLERDMKDLKSDFGRGLDRIVTVYTADGEVLKTYEGKIDLAPTEGGIVKFDLNGQRIMYYNCYVEVIEKVE